MHIIPHALSLLIVVKCVTVINTHFQRSKLGDRRKTQHSALRQSST